MLKMHIMEIISILSLLSWIVFATSSKYFTYKQEKIPWMISPTSLFNQAFHSTKVEYLYQCMELCSQYSICKSLWEKFGKCELYKIRIFHVYTVNSGGQYYEANWIPKSISGVCANHTCSKDKQCVPRQLDGYMCIPHKFPIFTCEKGWYYSSRKCHYIYSRFKVQMSWKEAKNYCTEIKSNLTEIQSAEEQTFLYAIFLYYVQKNLASNETAFYWTSLQYVSKYKSWIWNDSGRIQDASSFSYWSPYYLQLIKPDQDNCMVVSKNTSYHWTVANCAAKGVFICERLMV